MNKKSFLAVFAGVVFIIVVTTLVDIALHAAKVFPPMEEPLNDSLAALAMSYRVVVGVIGAWLTARLAPQNPMKHALILGCVGTLLGSIGVVTSWNLGMGPRWYPIAIAVFAIPQCWVGGALYEHWSRSGNARVDTEKRA
jgi:MFS family permease